MAARHFCLALALVAPLPVAAAPQWIVDSLTTIGCADSQTQFQTTVAGASGSGPERFRTIVDAAGERYMDEDAGTPSVNGHYSWNLYDANSGGPTTAAFPLPMDTPITVDFMFIDGPGGPSVFHRRVTLSQCNDGTIVEDIVLPAETIFADGFEAAEIACGTDPIIADGAFEETLPDATHPNWAVHSQSFGSPLCTVPVCGSGSGTTGPASGSWWSWFGGTGAAAELGWVEQAVVFPANPYLTLEFNLWIGAVGGLGAKLDVLVDGKPIASIDEPEAAEAGYSLRHVGMGKFADGQEHVLRLQYHNPGGANSNFSLDDVRLSCDLPPTTIDSRRNDIRPRIGMPGSNNSRQAVVREAPDTHSRQDPTVRARQ